MTSTEKEPGNTQLVISLRGYCRQIPKSLKFLSAIALANQTTTMALFIKSLFLQYLLHVQGISYFSRVLEKLRVLG